MITPRTPHLAAFDYLDQIDLAAASADAQTCHIGDGDHMLDHGIISHVNRAAAALGCGPGQSVRDCAELKRATGDRQYLYVFACSVHWLVPRWDTRPRTGRRHSNGQPVSR
jgi:hypothetical protein